MSDPIRKEDQRYSYADYLTWPDEERWELIEGIAYLMSPAPSRKHQEVLIALSAKFYNHLDGKPCKVYAAPFEVRLSERNEKDEVVNTVVQPDLTVVCDKTKLDDKGCKGSPDLIVEIVSPSSASLDYIKKLALYEKHGVKEYWIVHPIDEIVMIYKLREDQKFARAEIFSREDTVKVGILGDLAVILNEIFKE